MLPAASTAADPVASAAPSRFRRAGVTLRQPAAAAAVWLLVALGIALRMAEFATWRSLWLDEAKLALNITGRSFRQLLLPLSFDQGAPLGFLFIQKALVLAFGNEDYVLRLFPFAAGAAAVLAMRTATRVYLGRLGAGVALALFVVSGKLIEYSAEAKQYSSDVLAALLLLLLAPRCLGAEAQPKDYAALALGGAVAMWLSHPAVFILAGAAAALVLDVCLDLRSRRDRRRLPWLGALLLAWAIAGLALYAISLRALAANRTLVAYWQTAFLPPSLGRQPAWLAHALAAMLRDPVGWSGGALALGMALAVLGAVHLAATRWRLAVLLVTPLPAVLLASSRQSYPFSGRLLLFLVPLVLLAAGAGIDAVAAFCRRAAPRTGAAIALLAGALLLYGPAARAVANLRHPDMKEDLKPVMAYLQHHRLAGDRIYVYYGALEAFTFYAPAFGFRPIDYLVGPRSRAEPARYLDSLDRLPRDGRTWFVFSHDCSWCKVDEEPYILRHLDRTGRRLDERHAPGAAVYLYALGGPALPRRD